MGGGRFHRRTYLVTTVLYIMADPPCRNTQGCARRLNRFALSGGRTPWPQVTVFGRWLLEGTLQR